MNYKSLLLVLLLTTGSAKPAMENLQVDMLSTILQTPSILALDSTNTNLIKAAAILSLLGHTIKVINLCDSFEQKQNLISEISIIISAVFRIYACIEVMSSQFYVQEQIEITKQLLDNIKLYKVEQLTALLIELCLRGASIYKQDQEKVQASEKLTILADTIELLRLTLKKPRFTKD